MKFSKSISLFTLVLLTFVFAGITPANADSVIYLAPDSSSLYANNQIGFTPCCDQYPGGISGPYGVGNTITFAGSGPFNLGTVGVSMFGYAGGGSLPIEVDLYAGGNPNTGALLGSAEVIPTGNGMTTEVFNFNGLVVPQTLTYIVSIVGNNGSYDDSFVNWQQFTGIAGSPTIGTSTDMWYGTAPGNFVIDNNYAIDTGAQSNTLAAEFTAVPEPASLLMFGSGLLGFLGVARRKLFNM